MKLEICIDCLASAQAALEGGADRLEVCAGLEIGGLTPSLGLVEACLALGNIRVAAMIRPHAGSFCYDADELQVMAQDIATMRRLGVHCVVLGPLRRNGTVDEEATRRLLDTARPLEVTFHRAFDLTPDPRIALDTLVALGVDRVLTSGQAPTAEQGITQLRELTTRAGSAISVMAGAGIRRTNVRAVVRGTGVREVHASASELVATDGPAGLDFVHARRRTSAAEVRALADALIDDHPASP